MSDDYDYETELDEKREERLRENSTERALAVVILDTSGSMHRNDNIDKLNDALIKLQDEFRSNRMLSLGLHFLIIQCGGDEPKIGNDWMDGRDFVAQTYIADGHTPLGESIEDGLDMLQAQKDYLDSIDQDFKRAWFWVFSDGLPTDEEVYENAAKRCREEMAAGKLIAIPFGFEEADADLLTQLSSDAVSYYSKNPDFAELMRIMSRGTMRDDVEQVRIDFERAGVDVVQGEVDPELEFQRNTAARGDDSA